VLEDLLRKTGTHKSGEALRAAARSICKRIGFEDKAVILDNERQFLQAFYTAQRAHLEQRLLLGKRRLSKHRKPT